MAFDPFLKAVQKRLIAKGYSVGRAGADGLDGKDTRAAIQKFQRDNGLSESGMVTAETWAVLDGPGERAGEIAAKRDSDPKPSDAEWSTLPALSNVWPRQVEVEKFYGPVGKNQGKVNLPYPMRIAWDLGKAVTKITMHEKVCASAERVFARVADAYDAEARADLGIDLFGGSLNVRKMRGGSKWSMHSWGIAIDFDPIRNQLKWNSGRARLAKPDAETFWKLWEEEGWLSLGRARDFDWMHIQAARL